MANPTLNEDLQALCAAEIRANAVSARSRSVYQNSYARFISWLLSIRSPILRPSYASVMARLPTDQKVLRTAVTQALENNPSNPPIQFQELHVDVFVAWLLNLRTTVRTQLSFLAFNTRCAGLFNLFCAYKEDISKTSAATGDYQLNI
ncbi:Hypothetical protein PHPALM_9059 [Phytophthora palmivora]|uniref:Uncharacterized protein n=1 Tax=Phytophthora palmivora TaxID=4796 RepID=A0A2P4Y894_9STRA|nr:Hypothetical protein PHPALM_9059 [Phytophthora palmivora]